MVKRVLGVAALLVLFSAPAAWAQYVPGQPGFILTPSTVTVGGQVQAVGQGCPKGSQVVFTINGQVIGSTTASNDTDGSFSTTLTLPTTITPGTYTVQAQCGDVIMGQSLTVTGASSTTTGGTNLPSTGSNAATLARWALVLLAVGGLFLLAAKRRQHHRS